MDYIIINYIAIGFCSASAIWMTMSRNWKLVIMNVAFVIMNIICVLK